MYIELNQFEYYEILNLHEDVFYPLKSFMTDEDVRGVCYDMRLNQGAFFPIPILLHIDEKDAHLLKNKDIVELRYQDQHVGILQITQIYRPDKELIAAKIFGTTSLDHPGVAHLKGAKEYCVAGQVECTSIKHAIGYYPPKETKRIFKEKNWKTVAGFQTRNIPHKAHEYLQRLALEMVDGLFIQPLIGWKKAGDYTVEAIEKSYHALIREFYPVERVMLNYLVTSMRYAGPREALLHALVRRNFGCTHFIVGRDHAGVKNFYGLYDAQKLALEFENEIGIKIIAPQEPYYCRKCSMIVTERTCGHSLSNEYRENVSGTMIREMLANKKIASSNYLRKEVLEALKDTPLFIN